IDNWLRNIRDTAGKYDSELSRLSEMERKVDRLCELNVIEQVQNVANTTIVQEAWRRGQNVTVHGWIYGIKDGMLRDLDVSVNR
ncbi:MAG: carbonic anhydrase, partial [Candidatus Kapaibacterium sp.]